MNILFLTTSETESIEQQGIEARGIYMDLLRKFRDKGHEVYIVCSRERRAGKPTEYDYIGGAHVLRVKIGNITQTNLIEKGISTLTIESAYKAAIKKHLKNVKFDMVLYSTPPITFVNVVKYVKERDDAFCYLLLKDIFPQNAVDIGMLSKTGVKSPIYKMFRQKERALYAVSDKIGCMSNANCEYVIKHNPEVSPYKLEISPNTMEPDDNTVTDEQKVEIRRKYSLPQDKIILLYGGNLGKPQGIPFMTECIKKHSYNENIIYLVVGKGTDSELVKSLAESPEGKNIIYIPGLPRADFEALVPACDAGLIFLDNRFTIPNYPSRMLSYMNSSLPVIACTDKATDVGLDITEGNFGVWCQSDNTENYCKTVDALNKADLELMGQNAKQYLRDFFNTENSYNIIMNSFGEAK